MSVFASLLQDAHTVPQSPYKADPSRAWTVTFCRSTTKSAHPATIDIDLEDVHRAAPTIHMLSNSHATNLSLRFSSTTGQYSALIAALRIF
ncbi:hypothetical protein J7T55_013114 [Diaporthe amygdali]|uniref:uncharacterized protein n=1 Tax=Phomopsis amygdali TaxID=1214568 RepID=UPI0022FDD504|nr:uncharacterized protein J7T55_013114 [Diaporthe amygdali]KAJ0118858.1 hypothetical protein J7T55_013114 [Diaporthe amygdali]